MSAQVNLANNNVSAPLLLRLQPCQHMHRLVSLTEAVLTEQDQAIATSTAIHFHDLTVNGQEAHPTAFESPRVLLNQNLMTVATSQQLEWHAPSIT